MGGELIDEGVWFDIGNIRSYMGVHRILNQGAHSFSYLPADWLKPVQIGARIGPGASIAGCSAVAAGADVGENAVLENVIVWPDTKVDAGNLLRDAVVTSQSVCQCDCAMEAFGA